MTDMNQASEREAIEMLLPFYAMGTLDPHECARVDAFLDANPDMRVQLALIEDERVATVRDNEAIAPPRGLTVDALLSQLPKSASQQATGAVKGAFARMAELFRAPDASGLRWAAAAVVALVAVQSIAVGTVLVGERPGYELASGGTVQGETGTFALVRFKPDATFANIRAELQRLDLDWVSGPNGAGLVTLRISENELAAEANTIRIQTIKTEAETIDFITSKGGR